jgi:hypothetical protein
LLCITLLITPSNNGGFGIFCQNTCFYLFESNGSLIGGGRLLAWLGWRASIHVGAIVHFWCAFRPWHPHEARAGVWFVLSHVELCYHASSL